MFNLYGKSDADLQRDVLSELNSDPSVNILSLQVDARNGIVTIGGTIPNLGGRGNAEMAIWRINGVRAVADELGVEITPANLRDDEALANAALKVLKWNYEIPQGLRVTVHEGWVTLSGEADWEYERAAAKRVVTEITGIRGVTNDIALRVENVPAHDIKANIEEAIRRSAQTERNKISVSVVGEKVFLSGTVHSFSEMERAKNAAWNSRGVREVVSHIEILHRSYTS